MKAKNTQAHRINVRDILLIILTFAVGGLFWMSYETGHNQAITDVNTAKHILQVQDNANKLKACIDAGTRPCEINQLD